MKINRFGLVASTLAISAIASLSVSFARQLPGSPPEVPDHVLITGPVPMSDVGSFRDASTLWLTDVLLAEGAQAKGKKTKFNETTIVHTSVALSVVNESLVRHKEWVPAGAMAPVPVGGNPSDVKRMSSEQYAALLFLFDEALKRQVRSDMVADENGIRGSLSPSQLGMSQTEIRNGVRSLHSRLRMFMLRGGGIGGGG